MTNHYCLLVFSQMQVDGGLFDPLVRPLFCFNCLFVLSHKSINNHSCFACFSLIECAADPKPSYRMACRTCFLFSENQPLFLKACKQIQVQNYKSIQIQNNKIQDKVIAQLPAKTFSSPENQPLERRNIVLTEFNLKIFF